MRRPRKRLKDIRVNGAGKAHVNGHKLPSIVSLYPNLVRRKQEREQLKLPLVEALAMLGMADAQIAKALGITYQKFGKLKKKHNSLRVILHKGRVQASAEVVKSLYKKANGFDIPEEKLFYSAKHNTVKRAITRKYFPPDVTAQIFWLKNQYPELWRDKKEVESTGPNAGANVQSIKIAIVQPGGKLSDEKVIDADFKLLPGAGKAIRDKKLAEDED